MKVLILVSIVLPALTGAASAAEKPRIIATTDGEIDDRCSMVRFLLYTNEWDIEGIVISSSKFHWKGHDWAGLKWIDEDINLYAKSYENLKKHDSDFPSPAELKKLVYVGNIDNVGEMKKDTPGSDRIVEVLLDDKPGQTVKLSAKAKDPDGDNLSYKWWQYREPGSYKGQINIQAAKKPQASFELPEDAKPGQAVHIICEVTDDGDPQLTRYARVIVEFE